ncbi:MAG: hypothetical protein QME32_01670 [Endomicrobiia bacterium]|nr:hypothetical protein [Endomicrobiia bacterium]
MLSASSAGVKAVGALWGFRAAKELVVNGSDALVSKPSEVLGLLL